MHIIQLYHLKHGRRVGLIDEPNIVLLDVSITSTYGFYMQIIEKKLDLTDAIYEFGSTDRLPYDPVYN